MAKMIPSNEDDFNNSYGEMQVFRALRDGISDDYTVFHSFRWNKKSPGKRVEWGEADFTIFHARYGILVIEVKSGGILLEGGNWFYERTDNHNRYPMKDPLEQANRTKYNLKELIDNVLPSGEYCWIEPIVWFTSLNDRNKIQDMPNTYHQEIVFMEWALSNTKQAIETAYSFYNCARRTLLSADSAKLVIRALAPAFHAIPSLSSVRAEQEYLFLRLTNEQSGLLDYLDEQPTAAIQGSAGTGKTLLALEKAKRLSKDECVLFLCHNRFLMDDLRAKNQGLNIEFYNLPSLVKAKTGMSGIPSDDDITEFLNQYDESDRWGYRHIIIDEGQDFKNEHLELLAAIAGCLNGSFYVFYDKNQLVQRSQIPECLQNAECRLVLKRNCRNTRNIATTASRPIKAELVFWEKLLEGKIPAFYILSDSRSLILKLAELVSKYIEEGIASNQVTILTVKTEETSLLFGADRIGKWKLRQMRDEEGILFTTARKFKGLESDVVIIIDLDANTFYHFESKNLFYVGASRAKHFLDIVAVADDKELINIAEALTGKAVVSGSIRKIMSSLKTRIGE